MQTRLPISKPLLLVLIGLIIGASLGLGSGYAVFYPSMVRDQSRTIEDRVGDIEGNVTLIGERLDSMNTSMSLIDESLEGILSLSDVIQQISDRVSAIENGQMAFNSELDDVEDTLDAMNQEFVDLLDTWEETRNSFDDLATAYEAADDELKDVQVLVRENDGIRLYTSYMANPSGGFKDDIVDELYDYLILNNPEFADWKGTIYTETITKQLIRQDVDKLMGELVWNPSENTEVGTDTYQVKLETFFNFEFTPAGITVSKMHIEVRATINIDTSNITQKTVTLVEVV